MLTIMKKMTFLACAAVLTSAIALTSCKSEEPNGNPQYEGEVVKTEFAISLPGQAAGNGALRMPSATVQTEGFGSFQGMKGITLIPFINLPGGTPATPITTASTRLGANIHLGDLSKGDITKSAGTDAKNSKAKVYSNVSIPLTTGSFLFYAYSARNTSNKFSDGSLQADTASAKQPADFAFCLEPIMSAADSTTFMDASHSGGKLLAYLTAVATADDGDANPVRYWYQYGTDSLAMKNLFDTLVTMHGLSSFEVERVMTDLYRSVLPLKNISPMAKAITDSIALAAYATVNMTDTTVHLNVATNFPGEYNLPNGCIDIAWNSGEHKFKVGSYTNMARPSSFVYPSQLWYFANSAIRTSNHSLATAYNNDNYWSDILELYNDARYVNPRTRSVAIEDTVQYAVARLDVRVKLNAGTLADNSLLVEGVATDVDCATAGGFPVKAVLVGGQKNVGFDFTQGTLAAGHATYGREYTVYDTVMSSATMKASSAGLSDVNSTLLLQTGSEDVNIALELLNNTGVDFYGVGGQLIPKGSKFYVVGKLQSANRNAGASGGHASIVFEKDYTTTANLTLKSLKNAYNTIPDLRSPKLELGFAVDLSWQAGNVYDVDIE